MKDWRPEHGKTIYSFLEYLNKRSDNFILKGGTALLTCYELDRFSEDIDLDGKRMEERKKLLERIGLTEGLDDTKATMVKEYIEQLRNYDVR